MSKDTTLIFDEGKKLKQRIEAACYVNDPITRERVRIMDAGRALARATGEEVLRHILAEIKAEPTIKGGYAYPQAIRESADIDLLYMRKIDDWEFERAFTLMRPRLAEKGIVLTTFDRVAQVINTNGQVVHRYNFEVKVGPSAIKNHIDVTWGGPKKFPRHQQAKRHGSTFYSKQEPTFARYQSFESQAADKLISALDPTISRWKDYSDLSLLAGMSLDQNIVAGELLAKLMAAGHSADDIMALLIEQPESLSYDFTMAKAGSLEKVLSKYGPAAERIDAMQVFVDVRDFYQTIRNIIGAARIRKVEGKNPTVEEVKQAFKQAQAVKDEGKKVVTLSDYRLDIGDDLPSQLQR